MRRIKDNRRNQRRREIRRIVTLVILVLVILVCILLLRLLITHIVRAVRQSEPETAQVTEEDVVDTSDIQVHKYTISKAEKAADDEAASAETLTLSFMGDCTLGRDESAAYDTSFNAYYEENGPDYFLKNVRSILASDDLSVINLEGTLSTAEERQEKKFAFKGDPSYVAVLTGSSIEAANLANNHSHDYGEQSYTDTRETLSDAGIISFGYDQAALVEVKGVQVGLAGVYCLDESSDPEAMTVKTITALQEAGAQIIVVNYHWGTEKEYVPDADQISLAHLAVDTGADLVIGHHPHVLQGIEQYNGVYIAYSLGNFCFGGNANPEDTDTCILQQTFTVSDGDISAGENLNIIPCSLTSSSGKNDYSPTPLTGDEATRVFNKIEEYSQQIGEQSEADADPDAEADEDADSEDE